MATDYRAELKTLLEAARLASTTAQFCNDIVFFINTKCVIQRLLSLLSGKRHIANAEHSFTGKDGRGALDPVALLSAGERKR